MKVVEPNNDRNAGRKKIENGVIIRITVPKELINEFKLLVKNWREELQTKYFRNQESNECNL